MAKNTNPNWVSATAKYVRVAPRKARLVVDQVRNQPVARAFELLQFCERAVAVDVEKVLKSAVANAYQNKGMRPETLQIVAAYVDEGPTLKRIRPRAKGSASSAPAVSAAPSSVAASGTARVACPCTPCVPASTSARPPLAPPWAPAA